ncbi:hypothetical protein [Ruminococcus sp.]|uniref:hypothetical protein n=1 Tax=Ruminococcus sp. TaxID=41978 RepID=UPI001B732223|nr:hypothetical protein [Ruminococcus sp.]MBP5432989.1 hypothetical protein [Ruminococcus sp.]
MMDKNNFDNRSLNIACLIVGGIITLGLYIPLLNILALTICAFIIIRFSNQFLLCFLTFLLSFSPIFKLNINGFTFFNFIIIGTLCKMLYINNFRISKHLGIFLILFSLYSITISLDTDLLEILTVICALTMSMYLLQEEYDRYSLINILHYLSYGIISTSLIAYFGNYFPRISPLLDRTRIKLGATLYYYRFSGLLRNPNYYTMLLSIAVAAFCVLFINKKFKSLDFILFILISLFGFMSMSLSFIFTYLITLIITAYEVTKKDVKHSFWGIITVVISLVVIYKLAGTSTINTLLYRLKATSDISDLGSATTNRYTIWSNYVSYILSDVKTLLIGNGFKAKNLNGVASHNFYLETLYYLGVIGSLLFYICLYKIFIPKSILKKKPDLYQYIPIAIFLIRGFARNLITSEQFVFMLLLCSLSLMDFDSSNEEITNIQST